MTTILVSLTYRVLPVRVSITPFGESENLKDRAGTEGEETEYNTIITFIDKEENNTMKSRVCL